MLPSFIVGQPIKIDLIFTDETGTRIDPDELDGEIRLPTGDNLTYGMSDLTRNNTGDYHVAFTPEMKGVYQYRFDASNSIQPNEGYFTVLDDNQ